MIDTALALDAQISVSRGAFLLDVNLHLAEGEVIALLGPNGAGKSTLLNAVSGLIEPAHGIVSVRGRTLSRRLDSHTHYGRIFVPPTLRRVGLLGQDPLLFPHLSALENVAFGQRSQGRPASVARADATQWLEAVGLGDFSGRRPRELSGGQQQRVAIARALAARPDLLLLDEPLAALDVQTAAQIRRLIRESLIASGTTAVIVTHDVIDALVLADRVAILHDGQIIDDGPKERVLGHPKTAFIAALAGTNMLIGTATSEHEVILGDGRILRGRSLRDSPAHQGEQASAVFAPSSISIERVVSEGRDIVSASNQWIGTIADLEPSTTGVHLRLREDPELVVEIAAAEVASVKLAQGQRILLSVDPEHLVIGARGA